MDNAAEVIRKLIDDYIIQSEEPDVFLIVNKIKILNKQLNEILASKLYEKCKMNLCQMNHVKEYPDTKTRDLIDLTTFGIIRNIDVNSKLWHDIINESEKIVAAIEAQSQKIKDQINGLKKRLIEFSPNV